MSWSYSGDPTASPLDEVRFLLGDTVEADQLLSDEEINYAIKVAYGSNPPTQGNYQAAAHCVDGLISRYARLADKSVGDLSVSYSQRTTNFQTLRNSLRAKAAMAAVPPTITGTSLADKQTHSSDSDRVGTAVVIDGMTYIGSISQEADNETP